MSDAFRHRMRVRYSECDLQGVVFNANYFDVLRRGRDRALARGRRRRLQGMVAEGADMVVAEAGSATWPRRVRRRGGHRSWRSAAWAPPAMVTSYRVHRGEETLAEGEMRHVFMHAAEGGSGRSRPTSGRLGPHGPEAPPDDARGPGAAPAPDGPPADRGAARPAPSGRASCSRARPPCATWCVLEGAARRSPPGDVILCDVDARGRQRDHPRPQGARDPQATGRSRSSTSTPRSRTPPSARWSARPGLASDAVVWEEVENRTSRR